jgi:hypothetical protein
LLQTQCVFFGFHQIVFLDERVCHLKFFWRIGILLGLRDWKVGMLRTFRAIELYLSCRARCTGGEPSFEFKIREG